jgi:hypothetical protein
MYWLMLMCGILADVTFWYCLRKLFLVVGQMVNNFIGL